MNGGVNDAFSLADKLAEVIRGAKPVTDLDAYERQRRPIALEYVNTISAANKRNLEARERVLYIGVLYIANDVELLVIYRPVEGCEGGTKLRPMCAVQDSFKHWTVARRRIDYPIRECPVWRKATGGSGSGADVGQRLLSGQERSCTAAAFEPATRRFVAPSRQPRSAAARR